MEFMVHLQMHYILWAVDWKQRQSPNISQEPRILENEHRDPIMYSVHAPTKVYGCIRYEQNPLNIVGCQW